MSERTFTVERDCYDPGVNIYETDTFIIRPGLTVLVGCNGAGKSTLIRHMKHALDQDGVCYVSFDNRNDGGRSSKEMAFYNGDMNFLASAMLSSEGEEIVLNVCRYAREIGQFARSLKQDQPLWIFMDAVDSGLSIDNVIDLKRDLFGTILDGNDERYVYIIVSANTYEFASGEKCLDVRTGRYITFKDYGHYRQFIVDSRIWKDSRGKRKRKRKKED